MCNWKRWCAGLVVAGWGQVAGAEIVDFARQLYQEGNYREAYDQARSYLFEPATPAADLVRDVPMAVLCLQKLNRENETDALREEVIAAHHTRWRVLEEVARSYQDATKWGYRVAGDFQRGNHRGGGAYANATERDRIRSLQLMEQARACIGADTPDAERAQFYIQYAGMLLAGRGHQRAWELSALSDLSRLPDYDEGYAHDRGAGASGAPVRADGTPVYHTVPDTWASAATDGQRWRWLLDQAMRLHPSVTPSVLNTMAQFYYSQFGVQTLARYGYPPIEPLADGETGSSGTYALHTLSTNETIARLATGTIRFPLPDEFNHIRIFRELAGAPGHSESALNQLAEIFSNRRQYPEAAAYWRESIQRHGKGSNQWKQKRLEQIVNGWGQFESTTTQAAGEGASLDYRYRNGERVQFTAHAIDVKRLLHDLKLYLRSNPSELDWQKLQIANLGYRLIEEYPSTYVGRRVASWDLNLDPDPRHMDRRVTVTTPLQEPGAYLVTAQMSNGNQCRIVVWVQDTVLVRKPLAANVGNDSRPVLYFLGDSRTGAPVPGATVEFFGYWQERVDRNWGRRRHNVRTAEFAETSDAEGLVIPRGDDLYPDEQGRQWLSIATTPEGRFAFLGFSPVWRSDYHDAEYNQVRTYGITDRPVYRPGQTVNWKAWVRRAQYDRDDISQFAGRSMQIRLLDPQGKEIHAGQVTADAYGGSDGALMLEDEAPLGVYRLQVNAQPALSFRVEEYKKPEFAVTVEAPTEPVALGEKIPITVKAEYYFGGPVTEAMVSYKVSRSAHAADWYPAAPWDWLYGSGYWWFGYDYEWYPGWRRWGCFRPWPFWFPRPSAPPEIVAEGETRIGPDGTLRIDIDTELAKAIHGNQDHRYSVTAEVRDQSRRTIVGTGEVLVAREPFKVYAWLDRGYYRTGDIIHANFSAHTLDQQPVAGPGELTLYRIQYDDERTPVETPMQTWDLDTDARGSASLQLTASAPGQYRLSYAVTDPAGHVIEGGYVFAVRGNLTDPRRFRFNQLELVPNQKDYAPGDTVNLMINTEQADSTVLLFLRPSNGVYLKPRVLRLTGTSTIVPIEVARKDMPNFFVEAVTVANGHLYTEIREIKVPPEKRVLDVAVTPSATSYLPGEPASIDVTVRDLDGNPFQGTTVMTVYDKAVEYISGGSNIDEIRAFFWSWRRTHNLRGEHNLDRRSGNLTRKGHEPMQPIGVFGGEVHGGRGVPRRSGGDLIALSFGDSVQTESLFAMDMEGAPASAAATDGLAKSILDRAGAPAPAFAETAVRKEFADTACWMAALETDGEGRATVTFDMPENLTGWKIRTWAMGHGTQVGEGTAEVVTSKNLILRLQAPRFFVEKDEVVLSANIMNRLESDKTVRAILELDGDTVECLGSPTQDVAVAAGGEARVDWRVRVVREGEVTVRMKALTDEESDAMQTTFPVYVHGMLKTDSFSGVVRRDQSASTLTVQVPAERRPEATRLEIRYSPTLAGALVDALPYLAEYPYGCTEQTLSRFLPTVITRNILVGQGLDLAAIRDKRTNLNAQELGDAGERAAQWKRYHRNPVFDADEVERMVRDGLMALYDMQLSDGGWGWFSGRHEHASAHTTAYVVHGFQIAREQGLTIVPGSLQRGVQWLKRYQEEQIREIRNETRGKSHPDNLDAFVFMVLTDAGQANAEMQQMLYDSRNHLAVYAKAMVALACHTLGAIDQRDMLQRNIEQVLVTDTENQTAWLNLPGGYWWYWYGSEYEAHAYYLKLLSRVDPTSDKAAGLVKYLLNNRKHATYWSSTRDTAVCIEAMAEYLQASGEDRPDMTIEILVDDVSVKQIRIAAENLFTFDNRYVLEGEAIGTGDHTITVRRTGEGPVYFNAYLTLFSLEDSIPKAGLEIKVDRAYYRLQPVDKSINVAGSHGQVVGQKVEKYERVPLADLSTLTSGDLVEIELVIDSKNDYEYLVFEDMKPAGFEPVDVRSGYNGNPLGAYVEFRDEKVAFFVTRLARGKHSVSYRMRAEIPGRFSALPTRGYAMYAPELKANSDEIKLRIEDE